MKLFVMVSLAAAKTHKSNKIKSKQTTVWSVSLIQYVNASQRDLACRNELDFLYFI